MTKPLVSVIVPNYNYGHYLAQAIDSVLAQSYPHREVIIVDDGSTDNSETVVRGYGDQVKWLQLQRAGVSSARNRGVRESNGELVAFLDADDIWLPLKLEKQVDRLFAEPNLGLVHCGWQGIDKAGTPLESHLDGLEGLVANELLLLRRPAVLVVGSGALVPRATFEEVEGFDTRLSTSADWDFSYRIAVKRPVGFVPEVLLQYRQHGTNMHSNIRVMEHDMLLAFDKAFSTASERTGQLQRQSYGNLHMILAGSFFRAGHYHDFVRHLLKSLWLTPGNCWHALSFPARLWQRMWGARQATRSSTRELSS